MAVNPAGPLHEQELLDEARRGDGDAFRHIVDEHRTSLHAHCYRMLGSVQDAEDATQETLLRAWRGLAAFGGRSSLRTWLYRVATNVCLDALARRPRRLLPVDVGPPATPTADPGKPLAESVWIEPYPDADLWPTDGYAAPEETYEELETLELAFVAALQLLPPSQRAVLILREVLGFTAREVSESLDTTVAAVNSALQRARKSVAERLPERSQQSTLRSLGDERIRELVGAYIDAWQRGDVDALRALLTDDAVFSMPPWASWWRGGATIARFAEHAHEVCGVARVVPTRANGQPALAYYAWDDGTRRYLASALDVLTLEGERFSEITAFVTPGVFPRFGLASELTSEHDVAHAADAGVRTGRS
jgi:RNA polymerase sigma-70 factor (ECF subfamily)